MYTVVLEGSISIALGNTLVGSDVDTIVSSKVSFISNMSSSVIEILNAAV